MSRKTHTVGIALSADRVTAVVPGTSFAASMDCVLQSENDITEKLAAALDEIRTRLSAALNAPITSARVDVALLPPLSEARLIPLPPLQPAEAEAVIRRDAARHFVGGNGARTIAVSVPPRVRTQVLPVLATAAPAALVEQVQAAIAALGWTPRTVVPGVAAWLAASQQGKRSQLSSPRVIVAQVADTVHVIRVGRSAQQLRRVPAGAHDELLAAVGRGPGRASVWIEDSSRAALLRALSAAGWEIDPTEGEAGAELIAAGHAARSELELIPPSLSVVRQHRQRRRALQLAGLALLLVLAAGAIELWGAQRELASLRDRRAAIRQEVTPLLAVRDTLSTLEERLSRINAVQESAPHWTSALFDLAMLLPADAYLRSLRASGDTLVIEASGSRAGETIQALRSAPTLRDVQLRGQVERQLEDGSTSVERFTLQARLAGKDSVGADSVQHDTTKAPLVRAAQLRERAR